MDVLFYRSRNSTFPAFKFLHNMSSCKFLIEASECIVSQPPVEPLSWILRVFTASCVGLGRD